MLLEISFKQLKVMLGYDQRSSQEAASSLCMSCDQLIHQVYETFKKRFQLNVYDPQTIFFEQIFQPLKRSLETGTKCS